MDFLLTLLAAFGGGFFGAIIKAFVDLRNKRTDKKDRAAVLLWDYQFALEGFSTSEYAPHADGKAFFNKASFDEIEKAYRKAYPFAGYLSSEVRSEVFDKAAIEIPEVPFEYLSPEEQLIAADSAYDMASMLRQELDRVFPLQKQKKIRSKSERKNI